MKAVVESYFLKFTKNFEGSVEYMYPDIKGLVTIGYGNLIDPIEAAQALPFIKKRDGALATWDEITAEWKVVKDDYKKQLEPRAAGHYGPLTKLKLSEATLVDLCNTQLRGNETELKKVKEFSKFDEWPADAQLALHSMAWAMGPAFAAGTKWPGFRAACGILDFAAAGANCHMNDTSNAGLVPRNRANLILFKNAAVVMGLGTEDVSFSSDLIASKPVGFPVQRRMNPYIRDVLYYPTLL